MTSTLMRRSWALCSGAQGRLGGERAEGFRLGVAPPLPRTPPFTPPAYTCAPSPPNFFYYKLWLTPILPLHTSPFPCSLSILFGLVAATRFGWRSVTGWVDWGVHSVVGMCSGIAQTLFVMPEWKEMRR